MKVHFLKVNHKTTTMTCYNRNWAKLFITCGIKRDEAPSIKCSQQKAITAKQRNTSMRLSLPTQ